MEYIIASLIAIFVATFIVYKVANNILGLNLHIKPLLLCAVCAMFISLVLPKIIVGFAGLPGTLAALAIVAVTFAYFVARYENKTLLRQETREINAETLPSVAMEEGKSVDSVAASDQVVETEEDKLKDTLSMANIESELAEAEISVSISVNETIEDENQFAGQQYSNGQVDSDEQINKEIIKEEIAASEVIASFKTDAGDSDREEAIQLLKTTTEDKLELFSHETDEKVEIQEQAASEPLLWQEDRRSNMNDSESTESVQFQSEQLDDLIEFAFSSKENQDYRTAFNAFSRALTLYPNSQAAPFLVVEIGNILKNKGDYDEAIKVFSNGRNFLQTKQDVMIEQEFISTIAYLRIIKNILLQNNLGDVPFSKIPPEIIKLIDEEFREWRNVSNF
ncbi:hypothetical protein [Sporomusa acidovorans]|uniref:Tetratricopeptide repeat protein n=1 Tax=Sporomusa acidovorans (strain ATCC 49682 / DSM 3132 / Mol) TaxID=1123286 RepID=A0ABZ3J3L9_SPOA4|nr:hypothetical protein [Sporomusa acidovorans]OZC20170.1 hypothetical protein SPACI_25680 [Sporomusa acidovorans DSM 3132]SDD43111.1 hypothetical protein SAMN04488499_1001220 [Sporomusa acidovorans]